MPDSTQMVSFCLIPEPPLDANPSGWNPPSPHPPAPGIATLKKNVCPRTKHVLDAPDYCGKRFFHHCPAIVRNRPAGRPTVRGVGAALAVLHGTDARFSAQPFPL